MDIGARVTATLNGGPTGVRAENIVATGYADLESGDRIEIWVENQTNSSDITTASGSLFVRERSS